MLTETGYTRRTYDEIIDDKIERAQELFGEDIETDETTPLGKFIRINAYDQALAEEEAEAIYYARFPNTATGASLDRLCTFIGISRNSATSAQFKIKATGEPGKTVPFGFLVGTESELNYYSTQEVEIGEDGSCEFTAECTTAGTNGNVSAGEINIIVNPSADVEEICGVSLIKAGTDIESDYALRQRFNEAKEGQGSCNENSIRTALLRVPTVTSASVIVNESDTEDSAGRPPHSFECFISGGEKNHEDIAMAIYDKKPLGIKTFGKVSYTITDEGGYNHTINFSHTTNQDVVVSIKIKINTDFNSVTGIDEIKNNIITYINGLGVGNNVVFSSLFGKIHAVNGVEEVTELLLGKSEQSLTTENIEISDWEIAECSSVSVEVVT